MASSDPLDARTPERRREDLARTLTPAPPDERPVSIGLTVVVVVFLFAIAGVLWLAEARDDLRATRARVDTLQPCRP